MKTLVFLAAAAAPSQAAAPAMTGLWEGSIGNYPIVACFDTGRFERGSYYYRRVLIPIGLWHEDDDNTWTESTPNRDDRAVWSVSVAPNGELSGSWRKGDRALPIELKPVKWSKDKDGWGNPCHSVEYQAPRSFEPKVKKAKANLGGFDYHTVTFVPPKHFADNQISGFDYAPSQPGDLAIVQQVLDMIPTGKPDDAFMECMSGNTASLGSDGYVSQSSRPAFANANYISAKEAGSTFCGGAHPSHWQGYSVFDRSNGKKVNLEEWFGPNGFAENEYGSVLVTSELRSVVMKNWPKDAETECREHVATIDFWSLGLTSSGIAFLPSVAHALTPCGGAIHVSWQDIGGFLSDEGKTARGRAAQE